MLALPILFGKCRLPESRHNYGGPRILVKQGNICYMQLYTKHKVQQIRIAGVSRSAILVSHKFWQFLRLQDDDDQIFPFPQYWPPSHHPNCICPIHSQLSIVSRATISTKNPTSSNTSMFLTIIIGQTCNQHIQ